jgi:hypothetical protein
MKRDEQILEIVKALAGNPEFVKGLNSNTLPEVLVYNAFKIYKLYENFDYSKLSENKGKDLKSIKASTLF